MKNIVIIIQIAILILDLIRAELSESDITENVMSKFAVSEDFVKKFFWYVRKDRTPIFFSV